MSSPAVAVASVKSARPLTVVRPSLKPARPVVPASLLLSDNPAAAVFRAAAAQGPISRDEAARATGLSLATVNRQVTLLLAAGLLRERRDLVSPGAVGRPKVPFETHHESFLTIGIHIGLTKTTIIAADLRGRILGGQETLTPRAGQRLGLEAIARRGYAFAARWNRRTPLWVGVALGGRVDQATGVVDHPQLDWQAAPVGPVIAAELGLPVSVTAHVDAMAAAELLLAPQADPQGSVLYVYARESAGVALTLDGRVHTPSGGPGSIAHLPTGSGFACSCGRFGCLEATVGDRVIAERAGMPIAQVYRAAQAGDVQVRELLVERAETLGRTVAVLRDMLNPDRVILGGQAFTAYPAGLPYLAEAFTRETTLGRSDIRVSGFGERVQEYAAAVTSLSALYADPLGAMRRR